MGDAPFVYIVKIKVNEVMRDKRTRPVLETRHIVYEAS